MIEPASIVVHYACRYDNGSRKPRVRWNGVEAERATVQELYCPYCQFEFGQPGCLYYTPRAEWQRVLHLEKRKAEAWSDGNTCRHCCAPITNKATYCNACAGLLGLRRRKHAHSTVSA